MASCLDPYVYFDRFWKSEGLFCIRDERNPESFFEDLPETKLF